MIIRITARGDPDAAPFRCMFEVRGDADEVFAASVKGVVSNLEQKRRININQALLLLAARAVESLAGGADEAAACRGMSGLLSPEQVMIGVPEMTRRLDMDVEYSNRTVRLAVLSPIAPVRGM